MMDTGFADLAAIAPLLIVFFFGLMVLLFIKPLVEAFQVGSDGPREALLLGLVGFGVALAANIANMVGATTDLVFSGMVVADAYASFVHTVVILSGIGALLLGYNYLDDVDVRVPEYYALVLFSAFGMMLMAVANELILLFIAIEIMSIALYVLCGLNRGAFRSVESAFKYFILGAFSSAILLYGIAMVYGATGTTRLDLIADWFAAGNTIGDSSIMAVGVAMLLVGLGFKVAAVPFHTWSPDVYEGAPTPITAYMATGVKAASFAAFGRFVFTAIVEGKADWTAAMWFLAALTILVGNIGALVQSDLKRMLAYSSIGHAGFLLMALVAVPATGVADNPRTGGLLFYLLAYTIMNIGAFAVVSLMASEGEDDTAIDRLSGFASKHPLQAAGLAICLVSLAGIPPTVGFVGKFYLFAAAVEGGFPGLAVVGAIGGAAGVYYYLRPIVVMYMSPLVAGPVLRTNTSTSATLAVCVALILGLGVYPGPVVDWARDSVLSLADHPVEPAADHVADADHH